MKNFPVPLLLDPQQPADWTHNNNGEGEVIVCHEGKGEPRDIIFTNTDGTPGKPTPDMLPMDAEAKAISDSHAKEWNHPIESLEGNGPSYSDQLLDQLQAEVADARSRTTASGPAQIEGMTELLSAMTQMMKQNQDMLGLIAAGLGSKPPIESLSQPVRKV